MYEIEYTNSLDYIAKTVHSKKKILLGVQFRTLNNILRDLILEHEKSHSLDKSSELIADLRAINEVAKKRKLDKMYLINLLKPYRNINYINELKKNIYVV